MDKYFKGGAFYGFGILILLLSLLYIVKTYVNFEKPISINDPKKNEQIERAVVTPNRWKTRIESTYKYLPPTSTPKPKEK